MLGDLKKRLGSAPPAPAAPAPQGQSAAHEPQPQPQPPQAEPPAPPPSAPKPEGSGRWTAAPSPAEVLAYLAETPPPAPGSDEEVVISQHAEVFLALEGGVVVPHACIAVRGWLADEAGKVRALYLYAQGELRPLQRSANIFRADVNAYVKPARQSYRAGFSAVEPIDSAPSAPVPAHLVAVMEDGGEFRALISGRQIALSQGHHLDRLADELGASWCSPEEMTRLARPYLRRLAGAARRLAWTDRRLEVIGSGACDATLILVVERNTDMLDHLLAFLEMQPDHRRLGLVIVFSRPDQAEAGAATIRTLRGASGFPFIKLLTPSQPVSFGAAAGQALEEAEGETAIVCSDCALPPADAWIEPALDQSRRNPEAVLVPSLRTFDGRPDTLAGLGDEAPLDAFDSDHSRTLSEVAALTGSWGALGAGVLIGRHEFLVAAGVFDDAYTQQDFTFADAFHRLLSRDPASLRPLDLQFTTLSLPLHYTPTPAEALWNLYALRGALAPDTGGELQPPAG
jgi:hypothetical protein